MIKFTSEKCKEEDHKSCLGSWYGLGYQINCECMCHIRKEVEELSGKFSTVLDCMKSEPQDDKA